MQMHNSSSGGPDKEAESKTGKNLSPVLADYLIELSKQNNNLEDKRDKEGAAIKLFRPINF